MRDGGDSHKSPMRRELLSHAADETGHDGGFDDYAVEPLPSAHLSRRARCLAWTKRNRSRLIFAVALTCVFVVCTVALVYAFKKSPTSAPVVDIGNDPEHYTLTFASLGDYGDGGPAQAQVSEALAGYAQKYNAQFVVSVGDNIYPNGVSSVSSKLWQSRFERVYAQASLRNKRWYPVLGNHDVEGNVQAQIDYSRRSSRWTMPSRYYTNVHRVNSSVTLQIVHIDTNEIVQSTDSKQVQWLEQVLSSSTAQYLIVVGHHPVFSSGSHSAETDLAQKINDLLVKYKVTAYLSGHDHSMQYMVSDGVTYIVTGGGGASPSKVHMTPILKFAVRANGFVLHQVSPRIMTHRVIDASGKVFFSGQSTPRAV